MPGAGSSLDRNDYRILERLTAEVGRLADELERMNDTLEGDSEGAEHEHSTDE